jgi:serine/threonine protein kinase
VASPIGRTFGPYLVTRALGRGGMGETYLGERTGPAGFTHRVCLKRMRVDASEPSWVRMFQTEARLVAMLAHPNVVSLVDYGVEKEEWWMALALVEGVDLRAILGSLARARERLPIGLVVLVAIEIAKGLAHAHSRRLPDGTPARIVHRDLSPGNVMVSTDGAVLLTDFGIAKVAHAERTRTGLIKGKAEYMSPEHASGEELDGRADLFALGVVMFELITGVRPFQGPTDLASRLNAVQGRRPRLENLAPGTPAALALVVDRLLEPQRERRYDDARQVIEALDPIAAPPSAVFHLGELVRRTSLERQSAEPDATAVEVPTTRAR